MKISDNFDRLHVWMVPNETEGGEGGETVTDGVIEVSAVVEVVDGGEDGGVEVLSIEQVGYILDTKSHKPHGK